MGVEESVLWLNAPEKASKWTLTNKSTLFQLAYMAIYSTS